MDFSGGDSPPLINAIALMRSLSWNLENFPPALAVLGPYVNKTPGLCVLCARLPAFPDRRLTAMCQAQGTYENPRGRRQSVLKGAHGLFGEKHQRLGDYQEVGRWEDMGSWQRERRAPD